eukprot:Skav220478  [mRNA]  locus=scaffold591:40669:40915:+ [translate_table: standard]
MSLQRSNIALSGGCSDVASCCTKNAAINTAHCAFKDGVYRSSSKSRSIKSAMNEAVFPTASCIGNLA